MGTSGVTVVCHINFFGGSGYQQAHSVTIDPANQCKWRGREISNNRKTKLTARQQFYAAVNEELKLYTSLLVRLLRQQQPGLTVVQ